jgi:predicted DCC family thiol-disulfide oxidoreductase YuxK
MAAGAPTPTSQAQNAKPDPRSDAFAALPERIVFFDGICSFCDGTVRWLTSRDPEARLHFAPLQGETAALVRSHFPDRFPVDIDTLVYLSPNEQGAPEIALRSAAVFALFREIGGGWGLLAGLRVLPSWLTDLGYRAFARNRYRLFGTLDACDIPTPADRARLLP